MGVLMVRSDDPQRVWQENEVLLLRTVADQVTVAVNHARLFEQMQQQALTDGLTGCFNRRFFEMQLERDLHLATRMRQPVSLILLDIDHFKRVNDTHGHDAGDAALRILADALREELRGVDTAARYGGEEFAVILPQAGLEGALVVAERLRARIERTEVPGVGHITASFGVATFPAARQLARAAGDDAPTARSTWPSTRAATASARRADLPRRRHLLDETLRASCMSSSTSPAEVFRQRGRRKSPPRREDVRRPSNPPNV